MKVACVLDACAMIAFLRGEEGADAVTSDRHEFDLILEKGFCPGIVSFIR